MSFRHGRSAASMVQVLILVLVCFGCTLRYKPPELGPIYQRAAQYHGPERNPVVVIPGLLGSTLVDYPSDTTVWGAFAGNYSRPNNERGAQQIALPIGPEPFSELRDGVQSTEVLDRLRVRVFGLPLVLKAYFQIISTLGGGGYRDETLGESGALDWGEDHYTCFQFAYDFRRDNVENARRLMRFLEEKREYIRHERARREGVAVESIDLESIRFDIVAHSMGGLITRYMLRYGDADLGETGELPELTWGGAHLVGRAILIAPPNGGSSEALVNLIEGSKFGPTVPRYPPAVLGTFPSAYQLLPRERHHPLLEAGSEATESGKAVAFLEPDLWRQEGWGLADPSQEEILAWLLPEIEQPAQRQEVAVAFQARALRYAKRFHAALDRPAARPPGLGLYLVAGDSVPTRSQLTLESENGELLDLATAPGDGTVLRSSAQLDERVGADWQPYVATPIDWTVTLFLPRNHLDLTRDPIFSDNMLYWLLEEPREGPSGAEPRAGR